MLMVRCPGTCAVNVFEALCLCVNSLCLAVETEIAAIQKLLVQTAIDISACTVQLQSLQWLSYTIITGAACVVFSTQASYIAAVSARFMQLTYGNLDKKVQRQYCHDLVP